MEELLQAIANSNIEQQISLLPQALEYGESGIDFLIDRLNDPELEIRAKAYELLQHNQSQKVQQEIAPGLLINPGDKIYYIQESTMWFDDSFYSLLASEDSVRYLDTQDGYVISYGRYYTNYQQAKIRATSLQNERIQKHSVTEFEIEDDHKVIEQWCNLHKITKEVSKLQKEKDLEINKYFALPGGDNDQFVIYWSTVEKYLKSIENFDLLSQLWRDLVGNIVSICEVNCVEKTYLIIDTYYSRIPDRENYYIHYAGEDEDEFFDNNFLPEQAETRFLLNKLHHPNLKTRHVVYQLLKGIDVDEAQEAISQGVQLNSGDIIYSVYQSGMRFDDQMYYMLWGDVDYIEQLRSQINNNHEYDSRQYSQRLYCFVDKKEAEAAAETLHRKLIKERNFALEWRKENLYFDLKKWCIDNNFAYKDEWDKYKYKYKEGDIYDYEAIFEIKELIADDEQLSDNLRRSRYIYHPRHMDTWCKDNDICYEQICDDNPPDYWHNYERVLDYINLPENIELLSKFWKDGEGSFAFVKEEIVLQKVYIKIGEEIHSQGSKSDL
jgi:hypothetical protein